MESFETDTRRKQFKDEQRERKPTATRNWRRREWSFCMELPEGVQPCLYLEFRFLAFGSRTE